MAGSDAAGEYRKDPPEPEVAFSFDAPPVMVIDWCSLLALALDSLQSASDSHRVDTRRYGAPILRNIDGGLRGWLREVGFPGIWIVARRLRDVGSEGVGILVGSGCSGSFRGNQLHELFLGGSGGSNFLGLSCGCCCSGSGSSLILIAASRAASDKDSLTHYLLQGISIGYGRHLLEGLWLQIDDSFSAA